MGLVSEWIGKLMVRLRKVIILVEDDSSIALISRENKDVGVVAEGAKRFEAIFQTL